jgi:hypothetical protein
LDEFLTETYAGGNKEQNMKTFSVCFLAAFAACALSLAGTVEGNPVLSENQAKELARSASTPEQHLKLAEYYRWETNTLIKEARNYSAMADEYDRNPASHPIPKAPTFGQHCRQLADQDLREARKVETLASIQEQMAAKVTSAGAN